MKTVGIVAEYNPFHAGHRKQFDRVKAEFLKRGCYVLNGPPQAV